MRVPFVCTCITDRLLRLMIVLVSSLTMTGCSPVKEAGVKFLAASHYNRAIEAHFKHNSKVARAELSKALALDPDHPEANLLAAEYYVKERNWAKASSCLNRARSSAKSKDPAYTFTLADLYDKAGRLAEAEKCYREVYRQCPRDPVAQNNLGYFLANHNKNLDEALKLTQSAVAASPNAGTFVDSLGWAHYHLGHLTQARDLLMRAKKLEAKAAEIHYHLGIVFRDLKQPDNAVAEFHHANDLDPTFQPAKDELKKLGGDLRD